MSDLFDDDAEEHAEDSASTRASALALALNAAAGDEKVARQAEIFLREQTRLVRLQAADLEKEDTLRHWSLRVRHINDVLKLAFGVSAAFVVLMAVAALALLIWQAIAARGLVIQPIRTPPEFAQRGLDGNVLAQRLLDKMNSLVVRGDKWSFRSADTVSGNWGEDSKVEIPETGVSLAELSRFLRHELGHETSMSGELVRTDSGIALTVRVGSGPGSTFAGRDTELDKLIDQAAHALLADTQPYRYLWVLYDEGHPPASILPLASRFIDAANERERPWLQSAWEEQAAFAGAFRASADLSAKTIAIAPDNPSGFIDYAPDEWALGHLESAKTNIDHARQLLENRSDGDFVTGGVPFLIANCRSFSDDISGAYSDAVADDIAEAKTGQFDFNISGPGAIANDLALDHDPKGATRILAQHPNVHDTTLMVPEYIATTGPALPEFFIKAELGGWSAAAQGLAQTDLTAEARGDFSDVARSFIWPWLAYAQARAGHLRDAQALIARTPADCTLCMEMRGRIDELAGNDRGAVYWYGRTMADAASLPFAALDWGRMLMRHNEPEGAIEKFRTANARSPHNADALELWGEALVAKNRADLALAKFSEAADYAPHWGRLRLKWGEALLWTGDRESAKKQFAIAATLSLTEAEQRELVRMGAHG